MTTRKTPRRKRAPARGKEMPLPKPEQAVMVVPRRLGIDVVDARTRVAHLASPEQLPAGRVQGDYQARYGVRLLAASLTDPGRGRCRGCAS